MRILAIEDDRATAGYIAKCLGEAGMVVDVAWDGRDGLFLALNEPFDVIVTDRMLPGRTGFPSCARCAPRASARRCWC
jgi:two-component system OmpR family response regulator